MNFGRLGRRGGDGCGVGGEEVVASCIDFV